MNKIIYWIATAVMCGIFLMSAGMYLFKYEMVAGFYEHLGFPAWIIYPSAFAKLAGVVVVLLKKPRFLMEWAYAGFFFDAVLATAAHHYAGDGVVGLSLFALVATMVSRYFLVRMEGDIRISFP